MSVEESIDWWKVVLAKHAPEGNVAIIGWPSIYLACRAMGFTRWRDRNFTQGTWQKHLKRTRPSPVARLPGAPTRAWTSMNVLCAWVLTGGLQRLRRAKSVGRG